jgi:uncharacterized protein (DUF4415 family)
MSALSKSVTKSGQLSTSGAAKRSASSRSAAPVEAKNEHIVSYTIEELRKLSSQTDWARINAMTDEEIERSGADDPDWEGLLDIDWSKAEWVDYRVKQPISIRLDAEVLEYFKATGPRYQSRINAVLKSYVRAAQKRRAKGK